MRINPQFIILSAVREEKRTGRNRRTVSVPVVMTIFCTNTPAFCRQLTGKPPRPAPDELSLGAETEDA